MKQILAYLYEYVKINSLFVYFAVFLGLLSLLKYFKAPFSFSSRKKLILVVGLGLALRICWLGYSSHEPKMARGSENLLEMDLIDLSAIDLTHGHWFLNADGTPSGRRPIGYPLFLGGLYKLFGTHLWVPWISNLFLYAVTAGLIFLMTRSIFTERETLLATLAFAVYPTAIYGIKMVMDEHLFLPVWYSGIFLLFRETESAEESRWSWLWYGGIFGYAAMIRTHVIFMPLVVAWSLYLKRTPWHKIILTAFLAGFTMQLINLPWVIHNYRAWKVPVLYTATSQFVYAQMNDTAGPEGGGHVPLQGEPGYSEELERATLSGNEGLAHQIAGREMTRWILSHPKKFMSLGISRLLYFMNWNRGGGSWPLYYQFSEGAFDPNRPLPSKAKSIFEELGFSFYYIVLFSSLFSIPLIASRWKSLKESQRRCLLILAGCFFFWFLEHTVIYPWRKYRFPLVPLMTILATPFLSYILYELRWERLVVRLNPKKKYATL